MEDKALNSHISDYFNSLFSTIGVQNFNEVLEVIPPLVSGDMNARLLSPVSENKILRATK